MKIQNNKTRTTLVIMISIVLVFMILSPTTVLPNVKGFSSPVSKIAPFNDPRVPLEASVLQEKISEEVKLHPGWIGMLSWNKTNAKIDYLGPSELSPFLIKQVYNPWSNLNNKTSDRKSDPQVLNDADALKGASGGGGTNGQIISAEQSNYNLIKSTATVNNIQILDSMNSNNNDWLQVGTVYDSLSQFPNGVGWKVVFQGWPVGFSCGTPFLNQASTVLSTWANHDPIQAYISSTSTAGQYTMSALDTLALLGSSTTVSISGDTGTNTIQLGQIGTPGFSCYYPSGAQIEQWSNGNTPYQFGSDAYSFQFTLQSGSTTSTTTGFDGLVQQVGSGVTVSTSTSPAKITYNCSVSTC